MKKEDNDVTINKAWATIVLVLGVMVFFGMIILAPVEVEAHCKADISYASNEPNCWMGDNTTNCPLPTSMQCKIDTKVPFIALIGLS